MTQTTTTMRLIVDESQPPIRCCACGEVAQWAITGPTRAGMYEMQPFCHRHFHRIIQDSERSRKRIDKLRARMTPSNLIG
jgi:hypothetical protein